MDVTVSAANSALHRARVTLRQRYHVRGHESLISTAFDSDLRSLLDRYGRAWEAADIEELVNLLREDATLSMLPLPTWYAGREAIITAAHEKTFSKNAAARSSVAIGPPHT